MTALKIASLNMSGAQQGGTWGKFLQRMARLHREEKVDIVLGQEHGLHPSREGELKRTALLKGFVLEIAFAHHRKMAALCALPKLVSLPAPLCPMSSECAQTERIPRMPVASGNLPRLGFTQFHISHVSPPGAGPT